MFKYSKNGISVFIVLDRRRMKKSGRFPVKIEVVYRRMQKYYPTGQDISEEEWERFPGGADAVSVEMIEDAFYRVRTEVDALVRNGNFSFPVLESRLGRSGRRTVDRMLSVMMEQFRDEDKVNSFYRYRSTLKSVVRFAGTDIPLENITVEWLKRCEKFWLDEGKSQTTVSIYMKTLKAVMKQALDDGLISSGMFPYGYRKYVIRSGAGRKLALSKSSIKKIIQYRGDTRLEKFRDLWLFSYLCNGINFKDMLYLKYSNVVGEEIWYVRSKTRYSASGGKQIKAAFTPEMRMIVARWGNVYDGNRDTYLFRYASASDDAFDVAAKVRKVIAQCNRALARIAHEIGIPRFTTYSARHSFATVLKWNGADISYISESLGHSNLVITENYLTGAAYQDRLEKAHLLIELDSK